MGADAGGDARGDGYNMNHQGAHFRIHQGAHFRIWEGMQEGIREGMWEGMQEWVAGGDATT